VDAQRVLELGVGTGETARRVLDLHADALLTGIDSSAEMLERARSVLPAERVEALAVSRLEDELPAGPFDLVVSALVVHHLDAAGKLGPATDKKPSDVEGWIADLDWILGAQANVWFEKAKAEAVNVNHVLGKPIGDAVLRGHLAPEKDGAADVTVFLVGKWKGKAGGDPAGTFFPDLNVIAVDDKPAIPMVPGPDPFTVVLAHELVHYVLHYRGYGSFHVHDQHALLNDQVESTVIVPDLQWKMHNKK
jgi:SAM-dependent methyltransferase